MDEHEKLVVRVADWLDDGWDWDQIGVALGMDADEAYRRFGHDYARWERAHPERSGSQEA
jgi:hypothetical protein